MGSSAGLSSPTPKSGSHEGFSKPRSFEAGAERAAAADDLVRRHVRREGDGGRRESEGEEGAHSYSACAGIRLRSSQRVGRPGGAECVICRKS